MPCYCECVFFSLMRVDSMLCSNHPVRTMDGLTTGYYSVLQSIRPGRHTYFIDYFPYAFPLEEQILTCGQPLSVLSTNERFSSLLLFQTAVTTALYCILRALTRDVTVHLLSQKILWQPPQKVLLMQAYKYRKALICTSKSACICLETF